LGTVLGFTVIVGHCSGVAGGGVGAADAEPTIPNESRVTRNVRSVFIEGLP
jgi:hypothetical protein